LEKLTAILLLLPGFVAGLTVHEFSHAYVANRLGDPTARSLGRLTLNPLAHLDLIGSIMLMVAGFGWAKPVPVNAAYLRSPRTDMVWIAAAGPVSNLILAFLLGMTANLLFVLDGEAQSGMSSVLALILLQGIWINVILALFNLLPFPPLDGSRILAGFVPQKWNQGYEQFERIGPMILLGLFLLASLSGVSLFGRLLNPVAEPIFRWFAGGWLP
jgi:Zn-dependent protease